MGLDATIHGRLTAAWTSWK